MHIKGTTAGPTTIILAVLSSMGGFLFGYDTGPSPLSGQGYDLIADILLMEDFKRRFAQGPNAAGEYEFSVVREGLVVALLSIGTLIGALVGRYASDYMGRRKAIVLFCVLFSLGVIVQVTSSDSWVQIMMGRFISGWGVGGCSAAVPVYQSETVPKQLRGTLIATYQLMITAGILVAYCISIGTRELGNSGSWRIVIALGIFFAIVLGVGIMFVPESPRWLLEHDKEEEALRALARVRGLSTDHRLVQSDFSEMREAHLLDAKAGHGSWWQCFRGDGKPNKAAYRTWLIMILMAFQQSVGIQDSFITQIILGAINFGCTFIGIWVMGRFGRRWPLIIGGIWQAAWLFVFAGVGTAKNPEENETAGKVMIVSACLFIFSYASTWAPGIWILIGETGTRKNRARQAALATASNWLWNFLIAFFTPFITRDIGYAYGFVFAGCNLAGAIFVYFFLFESSKISLEMIDRMYSEPGLKAWKSGRWAPEGYVDRKQLVEDEKGGGEPAHIESATRDSRDSEMTARDHHLTGATMTEKRTGIKPGHYA
ncbi:hypothetical protein QFC20_001962 [Naganishia adeliensis]|uniref:Uncharacterized protein n=1 Tax=Naganishia adeliensis TaxID=92952 RepID=A0ACC2WP28_9TREE|nr:hypothetical protein QFC20_001962 [Naganishia adeliensis]